jgi:hypothetical protein
MAGGGVIFEVKINFDFFSKPDLGIQDFCSRLNTLFRRSLDAKV